MYIAQDIIIDNLNKYLEWHNLPVQLNHEGICNGLASVFAKYELENRRQDFFNMLQYVAGKKASSQIEIQVNHFIVEVMLSFLPELFDKKLNQHHSTQALSVHGAPIQSVFDMAMSTTDANWESILTEINLQPSEVMRINSIDHSISVVRDKENAYIVYDPNYTKGIKHFKTEKQLIRELHKNVFQYSSKTLGMTLNIIQSSDKPVIRERPDASSFYRRYLAPNTINMNAKAHNKTYRTLEQAAMIANKKTIQTLLDLGAIDEKSLAKGAAVIENNPQALKVLLHELKPNDHDTIQGLLLAALKYGRNETFETLLQNSICKHEFNRVFTHRVNASTTLQYAAKGGNPEILTKVIEILRFKSGNISESNPDLVSFILQGDQANNAISNAIRGGNLACVAKLLDEVEKVPNAISDDSKLQYLLESIQANHPDMVSFWIKQVPKEYLQTIRMSTYATQKTNLAILRDLKTNDVSFSPMAAAVIDQKEHMPVGFKLSIGIILMAFTDFCKEYLFKTKGVSHDSDHLLFFKRKAQERSESPEPEEGQMKIPNFS